MENLYKRIGLLNSLDSDQKIKIPKGVTQIRIDVGLSDTAPNTLFWLNNQKKCFVIGIEPLTEHWDELSKLNFGDRFLGIKAAISNTEKPSRRTFYHLENSGASSLLEPTSEETYADGQSWKIKKEVVVDTLSLQFVLDHIPWERFDYIEHIKTDCEGHDFEVVKSIGKYTEMVAAISSEFSYNNLNTYKGVTLELYQEFMDYLRLNDFLPDPRHAKGCACEFDGTMASKFCIKFGTLRSNLMFPFRVDDPDDKLHCFWVNQELKYLNKKFIEDFSELLDNTTVGE